MDGHFYSHGGRTPAENMGFDEYLVCRALAGEKTFCARLYRWDTGCITIGRNQVAERAIQWDRLGETPVIRRLTGGRALYHDPSELTYAFVIPPGVLAASPMVQVSAIRVMSEKIASTLNRFLEDIGVSATYTRQSEPPARGQSRLQHPCFASVARYELTSAGRKVVASAGLMVEGIFFQHGSIKLRGIADHPSLALGNQLGLPAEPGPFTDNEYTAVQGKFLERLSLDFGCNFQTIDWNTLAHDRLLRSTVAQVVSRPMGRRVELNKRSDVGVIP